MRANNAANNITIETGSKTNRSVRAMSVMKPVKQASMPKINVKGLYSDANS